MDVWFNSRSDGEGIVRPNRFWNLVELVATLVQILGVLVVLSLTMAKDEHPQAPLLIWVIGYTCACIATVPILSWRFHTYIHQDPSLSTPYIALAADEENNIQVTGGEYSRERYILNSILLISTTGSLFLGHSVVFSLAFNVFVLLKETLKWFTGCGIHRMMDFFKTALECFFVAWFWRGYVLFFVFDNSSQDHGSILYRLSMGFLAFSCIRYGVYIVTCIICPFVSFGFLVHIALYVCIIRPFEVDSVRESEGEDIVGNNYHGLDSEWESDGEDISCFCICLGKYGDKDEQIRELACLHVFHQECIEMWLRIKPSCPLCLSKINIHNTFMIH